MKGLGQLICLIAFYFFLLTLCSSPCSVLCVVLRLILRLKAWTNGWFECDCEDERVNAVGWWAWEKRDKNAR
ncbi:hypothetical protein J3E69DRAFT_76459 [Trichoderma sp. SZMC 28015]